MSEEAKKVAEKIAKLAPYNRNAIERTIIRALEEQKKETIRRCANIIESLPVNDGEGIPLNDEAVEFYDIAIKAILKQGEGK